MSSRASTPHFLRARKSELDQVFVNLINNATQAMDGKGRLTLGAAQTVRGLM